MQKSQQKFSEVLSIKRDVILQEWIKNQLSALGPKSEFLTEKALRSTCSEFLSGFAEACTADLNLEASGWKRVRSLLADFSSQRALQGFTPTETATFIFSLKQPLFSQLRKEISDAQELSEEIWQATLLIDKLGLYTMECFQRTREEVIKRQQKELLELSSPVIRIWDKILAIPIIGTLDSQRTQLIMEALLTKIVETGSKIAILDITAVPTVDTQTAQHLIKTVSAARLMGAECYISGIRPQIAQTIVHLGIDISDVTTKASMADAVSEALYQLGFSVKREA